MWFYHEGNAALREGDWKVIYANDSRVFPYRSHPSPESMADLSRWKLYNLADDRVEQRNLANEYPERVARLVKRWRALRRQFLREATTDLADHEE